MPAPVPGGAHVFVAVQDDSVRPVAYDRAWSGSPTFSDAGQFMYPSTSAVLDFVTGDLSGLSQLGRGACVPGV